MEPDDQKKWRSDVVSARVGYEKEYDLDSKFRYFWYVLLDDERELGDRENTLRNFTAASGVVISDADLPLNFSAALPSPEPPALLPAEKMVLTVALAQIERGDIVPPNTTAILVWALERLSSAAPVSPLPLTRERIDATIAGIGLVSNDARWGMTALRDALLEEGE